MLLLQPAIPWLDNINLLNCESYTKSIVRTLEYIIGTAGQTYICQSGTIKSESALCYSNPYVLIQSSDILPISIHKRCVCQTFVKAAIYYRVWELLFISQSI